MKLLTIAFVIATTLLKLVQPGCRYIGLNTPDFTPLCKTWWDKGIGYINSDSKRKSCISLINEKCPRMIKTEKTFNREYNLHQSRRESWTTEVKTYLTENPSKWMIYEDRSSERLCSYYEGQDRSKNCHYFWKVANEGELEEKYKETCINQIFSFCKGKINKIEEENVCTSQRCGKGYDVNTVTFEYNNEKLTYNRHVRQ